MRNLEITKTREHILIARSLNSPRDSYTTCWNVVDSDTGEVVKGGCYEGTISCSGYSLIRRKKDAKAWIDGYHTAEQEIVKSEYNKDETKSHIFNNVIDSLGYDKKVIKNESLESRMTRRKQFKNGVNYFLNNNH